MYLTDFQGHSCYFCILVQHPLCRHVAEGIAGSPIPPSALTALALTLTSGTCSQESSSMIQKYPKVRCSMVRKILQGSTGYAAGITDDCSFRLETGDFMLGKRWKTWGAAVDVTSSTSISQSLQARFQ